MFINHFAGFRKMLREQEQQQPPPFATVVTRDYLGQNFYWDGSKFPVVKTFTLNNKGNKMTIQSGTSISIEKEFASKLTKPPGDDDQVPIEIGNEADPKIPTQSMTAHGKPSKYAGNVITVPYRSFLWMIQPGDPSAAGGAGGGMGGMPPGGGGMPGAGGMPPPGGGMPGGSPGGMPPSGGGSPPM